MLHANGNVSMLTANSTLFIGNTSISNAGISISGAAVNTLTPGMRNRVINGAMVIDQRNAGASVTPGAATVTYTVDRFAAYGSQASKFSVQQNAGSVTPPAGFSNYLGVTSLSSYTVGASESFWIRQPIEGFNIADFAWGTANAIPVTLSFWVRSSLSGTFGGCVVDNFTPYCYPFSYTITSANTWEKKSITIAGPTSGSFPTTNSAGLYLTFGLGVGSSSSGTAGAWTSANYNSASGATSVVGTNGATWFITGVQLEVGTVATPFEFRQYGTELALCQRYYLKLAGTCTLFGYWDGSNYGYFGYNFPVTLRTAPSSIGYSSLSHYLVNNSGVGNPNPNSIQLDLATVNPAAVSIYASVASGGSSGGKAARLQTSTSTAYLEFLGMEL